MSDKTALKRTPLYDVHVKLGARMIEFGGWEMPVQYTSLLSEHRTVRSAAGLFDLSHMGELCLSGPDAGANLQRILTNDILALKPCKAQYTLICNERGGVVDDVIVYCLEPERYLVVPNAANIDKDREWIRAHLSGRVSMEDKSAQTALLAVQGPKALGVLERLTSADVRSLPSFAAVQAEVGGVRSLVSRTGYTGEDGFELYVDAGDASRLWEAIMEAGKESGIVPVGLGARDTLRLEARLPLYGNDLTEETTPIEAGLSFAVKLEKEGGFIGREALARQKEAGPERRLVGFIMNDRGGAPRHGYRIFHGGHVVGEVTSGSFSPTLEKEIGLGYVPAALAQPGTELEIEVRNRLRTAVVHKGRFIQRP